MKSHPFHSIRKLLQRQNKENQGAERQSRPNAPIHPCTSFQQASAVATADSGNQNDTVDVVALGLECAETPSATRTVTVEDIVSDSCTASLRDAGTLVQTMAVGDRASLRSTYSGTAVAGFSEDDIVHSSTTIKLECASHISVKKSNKEFSDTLSQWVALNTNCTTEFQTSHHHYDEKRNQVLTCDGVTTDHDEVQMKRRATTILESTRVVLPPGSCITSGSFRTTSPEENHCWNEDKPNPFENNEMFPDGKVKMPFVPLSSSIKQLFGLPPEPLPINAMEWLLEEAPIDLVPQVLSFVGSRKLLALSTLNSKWRSMIIAEPTWHTLCTDTGKWKEGDALPGSWLEHYCNTPCVPTDYNSVESALAAVTSKHGEQQKTVRILLHPATYVLHEPLVVRACGLAEVTIETIDISKFHCSSVVEAPLPTVVGGLSGHNSETNIQSGNRRLSPSQQFSKRIGTLGRSFMRSCISNSAALDSSSLPENTPQLGHNIQAPVHTMDPHFPSETRQLKEYQIRRAELIFKTRKQNRPLIHVQKGLLRLNNIDLVHYSVGTDIWSGNSTVHLQPQFNVEGRILPVASPDIPPTAVLNRVDITSQSGRGIVSIDGGKCIVKKSRVHHCAATGLYVGGAGSEAIIEQSDIVCNGNGNALSPRGIARGHSGLYVEQGYARVQDSNVSNNSLTGISAISLDNAMLHVENSDLIGNGTLQLELPPEGSRSFSRSINRNNVSRSRGNPRLRSGLYDEENYLPSSRAPMMNMRNQPQSPRNVTGRSTVSTGAR